MLSRETGTASDVRVLGTEQNLSGEYTRDAETPDLMR
jgi:hypothetical protein